MSTKFVRYALIGALLAAGAACQQHSATSTSAVAAKSTTPDGAVTASLSALRHNDVAGLLQEALPPGALAKLKADWHANLNKDPVTDQERQDFAAHMAQLTAPDAESKIYAMIEPKLKEFDQKSAQQLPMMIAMGQGFAQSAIQQSKDLTDQQKQQVEALLGATAKWAQSTKFTDPALVKQAIAVLCKTARQLNFKSIDEVRNLSYDQGMQKAGIVLGGVKQVLTVYGLDMDKTLDSVKVEPLTTTGDSAKVKVTYTAFDQPFTTEAQMVKVENRWYGKHAVEQWQKEQQKELATAAAKTAAPAAPAADSTGK